MSQDIENKPTPLFADAEGMRIGIVVAEWNVKVTERLLQGARDTLREHGVLEEDIIVKWVPGSFELPLAAQFFAEYTDVDGVIALGCIIQGDTRHFDFVAKGVTEGLGRVALDYHMPVIFGILTTGNLEQALDRAGGRYGNKGSEAAVSVLTMVQMQYEMEEDSEEYGMSES